MRWEFPKERERASFSLEVYNITEILYRRKIQGTFLEDKQARRCI